MHHADVERRKSRPGTVREVVDDFGTAVASPSTRPVTDDYGIQVTDNPIWVEQRLDPKRRLLPESTRA